MSGDSVVERAWKVSEHFTFGEMTVTDHRDFLDEQESPPAAVLFALARLCADVLEPARDLVGPLRVNSGYRCHGLNAAIGGSPTSAHMDGLAADVVPAGTALVLAMERIAASEIPYDQLILEYARWLHISAAKPSATPRRQALAIFSSGNYEPYNPHDRRILRLA